MNARTQRMIVSLVCSAFASIIAVCQEEHEWATAFGEDPDSLLTEGVNPYFILTPGYQLELKGKEGRKEVVLLVTVLDETEMVDGIAARVVEERESADGKVVEVSRNYFAFSPRTSNVYYFGEDVDIYRNGSIVNHEGSWRSGVHGARYGLMMPGAPLPGSRYYQEMAPGVAMDRATIISLGGSMRTEAGSFEHCLVTEETTPLEPESKEKKYYARGIGLVKDDTLTLVRHGYRTN